MGGDDAESEDAVRLFDEARVAAGRGDHTDAVAKLRRSVAVAPSAPSLAALGESLRLLSRQAEAAVYLAAAIGMGDTTPRVRAQLAVSLARIGDRDGALRHLRDLQRDRVDDPHVVEEIKRILSDPVALVRTANRHRLVEELRSSVPNLPVEPNQSPIGAFDMVGRYVSALTGTPFEGERLEPVFRFLNRMAVSADGEVADLLTAAVFPPMAQWHSTVTLARRMLIGKARQAFEDALALWGPPVADAGPSLTLGNFFETLRFLLPAFKVPSQADEIPDALARHLIAAFEAGASEEDLRRACWVLAPMAASNDEHVGKAFDRVLDQVLETRSRTLIDAARRVFSGAAHHALEVALGWDPTDAGAR